VSVGQRPIRFEPRGFSAGRQELGDGGEVRARVDFLLAELDLPPGEHFLEQRRAHAMADLPGDFAQLEAASRDPRAGLVDPMAALPEEVEGIWRLKP
jgi:hypothetical protein